MDEGRFLETDWSREKAVEELCWHLVDQINTWKVPQGTYINYARYLCAKPHLKKFKDIGAAEPAVSKLLFFV